MALIISFVCRKVE